MPLRFFLFSFLLSLFPFFSFSQKESQIDSLKSILSVSKEDSNRVKLYIKLASLYQNRNLDSFADISQKALQLSNKLNYTWGILRSNYNIGICYAQTDSLNFALNAFIKTLQIAEAIHDNKYIARSYLAMGNIYLYKGEYKEAEDQYWKALYYQQQIADTNGYITTYSQMGNVYAAQSKYLPAYGSYLKALDIAKKTNNLSKIALIEKSIADFLLDRKEVDLAIEYQKKASKIFEQLGDIANIANSYEVMGKAYSIKKNLIESEENYKKALEIYENMNFNIRIMVCLSSLADLYIEKGQYDKALEFENRALVINEKLNVLVHRGISYRNIGTIYLMRGEFSNSINMLNKSIEIFLPLEVPEDIAHSYLLLAKTFSRKADYKNAYIHQLKYDSIQNEIHLKEKERAFAEMQTKYETEKKDKELIIQQAQLNEKSANLNEKNAQIEKQGVVIYSTLSGLGLLAVIITLIVMINRRNHLRLKTETERNKLELQNKLMELEQKALRSQMNPHFIFNALNSIQGFISSNNSDEATSLLAKFAKLMRLILDNSREKMIPLENEIKMLQYYLELQQLSYSYKFDFKIEIDASIDAEEVCIPPMLIQPFVENAIVHGIANKTNNGTIILRVKQLDNYLQIEIEDDGVGREKALIQKKQLDTIHKSVGLLITKERINIFNEENQQQIKVDVLDLKDEMGNSLGTKGVLQFPLQQLYN